MDCSPSGSSVHGILQARILEQVAISFSRASSDPGIKRALTGGFFPTDLPGKPLFGLLTRTFISMIIIFFCFQEPQVIL